METHVHSMHNYCILNFVQPKCCFVALGFVSRRPCVVALSMRHLDSVENTTKAPP